jgi:hypothetical protein
MKKIVLIIFLVNFLSVTAQKNPNLLRKNPYKEATLYLRSGDTINGLIKLNSANEIVFKENDDSEKTIYDYKIVKRLTTHIDNIKRNFEYKIIREEKFKGKIETYYHLLEPVMIGKITVYLDDYEAYDNPHGFLSHNGIFKKNIGYTTNTKDHRFYLSKEKSDVVSLLGIATTSLSLFKISPNTTVVSRGKILDYTFYNKPFYTISDLEINPNSKYFKKIAKKYFSDCSNLISKIESGFFDKNGLVSVLNYYNKKCEE